MLLAKHHRSLSPRVVAPPVTEDASGADDERLCLGSEVAGPVGGGVENPGQRVGELLGQRFVRCELEKRPDGGLAVREIGNDPARLIFCTSRGTASKGSLSRRLSAMRVPRIIR
jgi:hypothetical protein